MNEIESKLEHLYKERERLDEEIKDESEKCWNGSFKKPRTSRKLSELKKERCHVFEIINELEYAIQLA